MGSVTKPYTCAAVMQQYERGKLDIVRRRTVFTRAKQTPAVSAQMCAQHCTSAPDLPLPTPTSGRPLPVRAAPVGPWTANPSAPDLCTFAFLTAPCRYPRAPGAGGSGADS